MVGISHSTQLNVWPEGSIPPGPSRKYPRQLKVAMTHDQANAVEDLAQELGCTEPEVMRRALNYLRAQRRLDGYGSGNDSSPRRT